MDRSWDDSEGWSAGAPDDWDSDDWEEYFAGPEDCGIESLSDSYDEPEFDESGDFVELSVRDESIAAQRHFSTNVQISNPNVYHLTSLANLQRIGEGGAILPPNEISRVQSLGWSHLIDKGQTRQVPVAPGGTLADYVRFYFTPFTPYSWHVGKRPDRASHVLIVVPIRRLLGVPCLVTNCNALANGAVFHPGSDFEKVVDWDAVQSSYSSTNKHLRQAELLVRGPVPTDRIGGVLTRTPKTANDAAMIGFPMARVDARVFY